MIIEYCKLAYASNMVIWTKFMTPYPKTLCITFKHFFFNAALWGVVNNAGIANLPGYLEWTRREDYEKVLAVNLFGVVDVTLSFLPLLKESSGRLVNIASVAGRVSGLPGGYSESKFAVEAFSDAVR